MDDLLLWAWKRCPYRMSFWIPLRVWLWWTDRVAAYLARDAA